jgi:hypothetical protein
MYDYDLEEDKPMKHKRLIIAIFILVITIAMVMFLSAITTKSEQTHNYNCSEFRSWREARDFFKRTGGTENNDPYGLDTDHDGIPCEYLI